MNSNQPSSKGQLKNPLNKIENRGAIMMLTSLIVNAGKHKKSYVTVADLRAIKKGMEAKP